jgi:trk system potassium uptake protein TrkH
MNLRIICRVLGFILVVFSLSMLTMLPFALWYREVHSLIALLESMGIGLMLAAILYLIGRSAKGDIFRREAVAVVSISWILVAALGALPFVAGGMTNNYTDAYFEAMSGLTTTGSTTLTFVEGQPRALLFWRSFLHFIGGLGIVVFFVAVLPLLGVGAKTLFKQEATGPVPEGLTPRIKDTALGLCKIYIGLNLLQFVVLMICGMSFFDALNHAMATMATGGFSTRNSSIAHYTPLIEWVCVIFMFLAGTNFSLHLRALKGDWRCYWRSHEFRLYAGIVLIVSLFFIIILHMSATTAVSHPGELAVRDSFFTTLTIMTTTGFGTVDYDQWPNVCRMVILLLMFAGGMAGSTAGGIKLIRFLILWKIGRFHLAREASPHRVRTIKVDGRPLELAAQRDTLVFFFFYMATFTIGCVLVCMLMPNQSLVSSVTAVVACLNNIGPGLEAVGPMMNFSTQSSAAKWVLSGLMLLGRLELFVVLMILSPNFWRAR